MRIYVYKNNFIDWVVKLVIRIRISNLFDMRVFFVVIVICFFKRRVIVGYIFGVGFFIFYLFW